MIQDETPDRKERRRKLGDEWIDWDGSASEPDASESSRTFLALSLLVFTVFIGIVFMFWYLVLPRFELFGRNWAVFLTVLMGAAVLVLVLWYGILVCAVIRNRRYFNLCLARGGKLFFLLLPLVMRIAGTLGISKDRLRHSFIRVSNTLAGPVAGLSLIHISEPTRPY